MKPIEPRNSKLADRTFGVAVIATILFVGGLIAEEVPLAMFGLVVGLVSWPIYVIVRSIQDRR